MWFDIKNSLFNITRYSNIWREEHKSKGLSKVYWKFKTYSIYFVRVRAVNLHLLPTIDSSQNKAQPVLHTFVCSCKSRFLLRMFF